MIGGLGLDLRLSLRSLRRSPGFTTAAVLTLGLGIGATAAIYSVLEAVLLRPLPYPEVGRLVVPRTTKLGASDSWSVAYADFRDWQEQGVFDSVALYQDRDLDVNPGEEPIRVSSALVSQDFFKVLRTSPALGREFRSEEFVRGAALPVIVSDALWRSAFGGAPSAVGRTIQLGGREATIAGVMPREFDWPRGTLMWVPLRLTPSPDLDRRDNFVFTAVARLRQDTTLDGSRARLATLAKRIADEQPALRKDVSVTALPIDEFVVGSDLRRALWTLFAAVGFVLLIGCVNVANLLLARGSARRQELAMLAALGASRKRLVRQLLVESLLLAIAGGACGVLLAVWGVGALATLAPADVPRLADVRLSPAVLAFTLLTSVLAAILSGLAPALQVSALRPGQAFDVGGRGAVGPRGRRLRDVLVAAELALSLVLLAAAGLMARSLERLRGVEPGVALERVVTVQVSLPHARYEEDEAVAAFFETLADRLQAAPGVRSAAAASAIPLGGGGFYLGRAFLAEGQPAPPAGPEVEAMWNNVSPGYFRTVGTPMLAGRDFTPRDDAKAPPVAIINEAFARKMFPGVDPLGKRVQSWREEKLLREVVGVVANVRYFGASDDSRPLFYVPHRQNTWGSMVVVARGDGSEVSLPSIVRSEIKALDKDLAPGSLQTMEQVMSASVATPRFNALLLSLFAGLALLLAAVGLYGVMSYAVTTRTREIGVRMALGARAGDVLRHVLGRTCVVVAIGLAAGLLGAVTATRLLRSLLFEISPGDPATVGTAAALLLVVALFAAWLPARRASRVDPMVALRYE